MVPKGNDPILVLRKLYCGHAVESSEQIEYVGKMLKYKSAAKSKWEQGGYGGQANLPVGGIDTDPPWEYPDYEALPHKTPDSKDHTWKRYPTEAGVIETVDEIGVVRRFHKGVETVTLIPVATDTTGERIYGCISCGAEKYANQLSLDGWCLTCDKYFIDGIVPDGKSVCSMCNIPFAKEDLEGGLCQDCRKGGPIGDEFAA